MLVWDGKKLSVQPQNTIVILKRVTYYLKFYFHTSRSIDSILLCVRWYLYVSGQQNNYHTKTVTTNSRFDQIISLKNLLHRSMWILCTVLLVFLRFWCSKPKIIIAKLRARIYIAIDLCVVLSIAGDEL